MTYGLEGRCSIQLSYGRDNFALLKFRLSLLTKFLVGVRGFEPLTTWSQTRYATRLRHTPKVSNYTVIGLLVNAYFEPYLIYFICTIYLLFKVVIVKVSFLFICVDYFDIIFIGNIIFDNCWITDLGFNA